MSQERPCDWERVTGTGFTSLSVSWVMTIINYINRTKWESEIEWLIWNRTECHWHFQGSCFEPASEIKGGRTPDLFISSLPQHLCNITAVHFYFRSVPAEVLVSARLQMLHTDLRDSGNVKSTSHHSLQYWIAFPGANIFVTEMWSVRWTDHTFQVKE